MSIPKLVQILNPLHLNINDFVEIDLDKITAEFMTNYF
jgi:hypothetical protein